MGTCLGQGVQHEGMTVRDVPPIRPAELGTVQPGPGQSEAGQSQGGQSRSLTFQSRCRGLSARLAASLDGQPEHTFPQAALDLLRRSGFWGAGLAAQAGGPGLDGRALLELLRAVGRASLPLGRLFEGHVNALALVSAYGNAEQIRQAERDVKTGHLYGVWNTEGPDGVRLVRQADPLQLEGTVSARLTLQGAKTFASGGLHVTRPLLPVEGPGGRQLALLRTEDPGSVVREQPGSWQPLGMAATHSVKLDFSGSVLRQSDLIGAPGDYYRQPMFSVGALRFCSVQLGGADTLLAETAKYLHTLGRSGDKVQQLRFAPVWQGLQAASLALAEGERLEWACAAGQSIGGQETQDRLLVQVDAVRLATEDACLALLEACERAVGARGLMEPWPFSRLIRDLRMYLRQPAPDAARLRLGRWVLEHASGSGVEWGPGEPEPSESGVGSDTDNHESQVYGPQDLESR